jgi:hypothetical protein
VAAYVDEKHKLSESKWIIYPRDMYVFLAHEKISRKIRPSEKRVNALYSGGLGIYMKDTLTRMIGEFERSENGFLYLCGVGGEWADAYIKKNRIYHSRYVGILNYAEHDYLASRCDFGLIIYPENSYCDFKPTTKYCSYVSNKLPILSVDLQTLKKILQEDGTGIALPEALFFKELRLWLLSPERFSPFRKASERMSEKFIRADFMRCWLDELLEYVKVETESKN